MKRPAAIALAAAIAAAAATATTGCESTVARGYDHKKNSDVPMAVKMRKRSNYGY